MSKYFERGSKLRQEAKALVIEYMRSAPECASNASGLKQSAIFRECGFDWGDYPKNTSSNQQYWVAAMLQELAAEGKIERVSDSGPWRLK